METYSYAKTLCESRGYRGILLELCIETVLEDLEDIEVDVDLV